MGKQSPTRREYLVAACVTGVAGLAGCANSETGTETENTETETEATTQTETRTEIPEGIPITFSGQLVNAAGQAVTNGEAIVLGPNGLISKRPDSDGTFSMDLTTGGQYVFQYTQGVDQYPTDGLPDLYTIETFRPASDIDRGEITIPTAYEVDVAVETTDGTDVTDETDRFVNHTNNGVTSGFELTHNPIELTGEVEFKMTYDGEETKKNATISEDDSVTVTV